VGEESAQRGVGGVDEAAFELELTTLQQPESVALVEHRGRLDGHRW
jgi:hypothetical protein